MYRYTCDYGFSQNVAYGGWKLLRLIGGSSPAAGFT